MNATTPRPLPVRRLRSAGRTARRLFMHYDDPPGTDSYALPSEIALRPIEPHYQMRR